MILTKASEKEEQYFREQELKARLHKLAQEQKAMAADEKRRLKEQHWMHCPKCGQQLAVEKNGVVEIDVCPHCKGLWLDAHELDQIIMEHHAKEPLHRFLKVLGA
jgi:acetyl-CoA carboxylase beta subunit